MHHITNVTSPNVQSARKHSLYSR